MPISDIDTFNFHAGRVIARKYIVEKLLGSGWEAEVYLVRECATGIEHPTKQIVLVPSWTKHDLDIKFGTSKTHGIFNFWVGLLDMDNLENHWKTKLCEKDILNMHLPPHPPPWFPSKPGRNVRKPSWVQPGP